MTEVQIRSLNSLGPARAILINIILTDILDRNINLKAS